MAFLMSCWFIIESVVIPDGYLKWFYLSFYIHPIFLFLCQVFLWLKFLKNWFSVVVSYPLRLICFVGLCVLKFFKNYFICIFSSSSVTKVEIMEEIGNLEAAQNYRLSQHVNSHSLLSTCFSSIVPITYKLQELEDQKYESERETFCKDDASLANENKEYWGFCVPKDMSLNGYLPTPHSSSMSTDDEDSNEYLSSPDLSSTSPAQDSGTDESPTSVCNSNSLVVERQVTRGREDEGSDAFYKKYCERMGWFDLLNYDRTWGISTILNRELETPCSFESMKSKDFSVPYTSWSKMAKKRLLTSIQSDFELVYVAQSCLSWQALHHQYTKVEDLATSGCQSAIFHHNAAGEFQRFQVLLERFLEDERCQGKRVRNYVRGRFALKSLLQVPKLSGFLEEENQKMRGESVDVQEVLKAMDKCVEAFWIFVKTDHNEKPWWKFRSFLWTYPPVEDPRDIELLADLTRKLQKKELLLKDLQGKKRCWFKKVTDVLPLEESPKKEILFTMIELKLVSMVLQMSVVSSSQLKWCQEMLDSLEFKGEKVFRAHCKTLFPPS